MSSFSQERLGGSWQGELSALDHPGLGVLCPIVHGDGAVIPGVCMEQGVHLGQPGRRPGGH